MAATAKKTKSVDRPALLGKYLRSLELGKRRYKQADAALELLLGEMKPGDVVELKNGKKFKLSDRYEKKIVVFQPCGVRRYEFEEVTEP